eukprot:1143207-Pelagomonas_calceolata.AAC.1
MGSISGLAGSGWARMSGGNIVSIITRPNFKFWGRTYEVFPDSQPNFDQSPQTPGTKMKSSANRSPSSALFIILPMEEGSVILAVLACGNSNMPCRLSFKTPHCSTTFKQHSSASRAATTSQAELCLPCFFPTTAPAVFFPQQLYNIYLPPLLCTAQALPPHPQALAMLPTKTAPSPQVSSNPSLNPWRLLLHRAPLRSREKQQRAAWRIKAYRGNRGTRAFHSAVLATPAPRGRPVWNRCATRAGLLQEEELAVAVESKAGGVGGGGFFSLSGIKRAAASRHVHDHFVTSHTSHICLERKHDYTCNMSIQQVRFEAATHVCR